MMLWSNTIYLGNQGNKYKQEGKQDTFLNRIIRKSKLNFVTESSVFKLSCTEFIFGKGGLCMLQVADQESIRVHILNLKWIIINWCISLSLWLWAFSVIMKSLSLHLQGNKCLYLLMDRVLYKKHKIQKTIDWLYNL